MAINNEDFFQINTDILASFHKHRLPLSLYVLRDDIAVLEPFYKKGNRLTDEQSEELVKICEGGNLFVSHQDQDVYMKHIAQQLDLVLLDPHLTDGEIAETCIIGIHDRYVNFYDQPVPDMFDRLYRDVMVLTEYLWADRYRILPFIRRLFRKATPARHAINTMCLGTWLWMQQYTEYTRKELDRMMLAMVLHDCGMCKIQNFILNKTGRLKTEERDTIMQHPMHSIKLMQKCDMKHEEVLRACLEHHERLDGSGYPNKAKGTQISTVGKLTALADSFSAMISERSYAKAKQPDVAGKELFEDTRYDRSLAAPLASAFIAGAPFAQRIDMDAKLEAKKGNG